jgi:membrane protease YdiL (CAAX protease family)
VKNITLRVLVSIIAIIVPLIFLFKGIFGSFIFTFSIPLLWQFGIMKKPISSLGVKPDKINASIVAGVITGCFLGSILKFIGVAGYIFSSLHKLQLCLGPLNVTFSLQKELGYRLLAMSDSFTGLCAYALFSIFIIGFGEEFLWRGFIQRKLSGHISTHKAILITSILFSLIHFYVFTILPVKTGMIFLLLIAIAGMIWGYLSKYFGNIWASAISHGITAFIVWKYYFFK